MPFDLTVGVNSSSTPKGFHSVVAMPLWSVTSIGSSPPTRNSAGEPEIAVSVGSARRRMASRSVERTDRGVEVEACWLLMPIELPPSERVACVAVEAEVDVADAERAGEVDAELLEGVAAHFGDRDLEHDLLAAR